MILLLDDGEFVAAATRILAPFHVVIGGKVEIRVPQQNAETRQLPEVPAVGLDRQLLPQVLNDVTGALDQKSTRVENLRALLFRVGGGTDLLEDVVFLLVLLSLLISTLLVLVLVLLTFFISLPRHRVLSLEPDLIKLDLPRLGFLVLGFALGLGLPRLQRQPVNATSKFFRVPLAE